MDKELELFLRLNIQRFAEDEADNDVDSELDDVNDQNTDDSQDDGAGNADGKDGGVDTTKAFSKRLREKTEELEAKYSQESEKKVTEKLDEVAKLHGYDTWKEYEDAVNNDLFIEAGVEDPAKIEKVIQKMISQNPEVIKAKRIIEQTERENYNKSVSEQIDLINKIDPSINSLDDLSRLDCCKEITEKVKSGYKLYDAYVICNLDKIQNNKDFNKQRNQENVDSKSHIKTSSGKHTNNVEVPTDIYNMYKKNTKLSDEQIREHYKKSLEG